MSDAIRFPALRDDVAYSLKVLADSEYQQRVWLDRQPLEDEPIITWDTVVNVLYDDAQLGDGARAAIGDVLRDESEARAVDTVLASLEQAFAQAGGIEAPVDVLLDTPAWPAVVKSARTAHATIEGRHPEGS
jgi:hypothetical protein